MSENPVDERASIERELYEQAGDTSTARTNELLDRRDELQQDS